MPDQTFKRSKTEKVLSTIYAENKTESNKIKTNIRSYLFHKFSFLCRFYILKRKSTVILQRQDEAASRIQAGFRGFKVRAEMNDKKNQVKVIE